MAEPEVTKVVFPENLERFKGNQDDYNNGRFSLKTHEVRPATGLRRLTLSSLPQLL